METKEALEVLKRMLADKEAEYDKCSGRILSLDEEIIALKKAIGVFDFVMRVKENAV